MGTHLRFTPALAMIGALALGGTSAARAQDTSAVRADTSAAVRTDTSGYQGYGRDTAVADTARAARPAGEADSGAAGYQGAPTDTALKAEPGLQTGPAAGDSGTTGQKRDAAADRVVCKDGSSAARTGDVCLKHGGIDWAATNAALKARGEPAVEPGDSASSDTILRAKPGTQTGPDTNTGTPTDTSSPSR